LSEGFDPAYILPDVGFVAPSLEGCVEGWRAWRLPRYAPRFGNAPKLYSINAGKFYPGAEAVHWPARRWYRAQCESCGDAVPGDTCSCGFYSAKTPKHLFSMSYHLYDGDSDLRVVGRVANAGKVREGTQGWRAQFSYPIRLFVPFEAHRLARPLSEAYGVPVELANLLKPRDEITIT
jgi:hypothetical protein